MSDPEIHQTTLLKEITVDYTPEVCTHTLETNEITVLYDERGGSRWRTKTRYQYGTFGAKMKCPDGNTNGLNFNLYLSSLEGDKSQDEIDFEFLGNNKGVVQTNHYTGGTGSKEQIHDLGFDCSDGFHDYEIKWSKDYIEWSIDGKVIRRDDNEEGVEFPEKAMFLYASVWDASGINEGEWTGIYEGDDAPYACMYKDVRVPLLTAVLEASEDRGKNNIHWKLEIENCESEMRKKYRANCWPWTYARIPKKYIRNQLFSK